MLSLKSKGAQGIFPVNIYTTAALLTVSAAPCWLFKELPHWLPHLSFIYSLYPAEMYTLVLLHSPESFGVGATLWTNYVMTPFLNYALNWTLFKLSNNYNKCYFGVGVCLMNCVVAFVNWSFTT